VAANMTPTEIINVILALKAKSQALHPKAQSITLADGQLITSGQGSYPQIIAGLHEIISTATNFITDVDGSPQVGGNEAASIANAFKDFVHVHQVFLHSLTVKAGLFISHPSKVRQPIVDILRHEKDILESFGLALIEVTKSKQTEIKNQQNSLIQTIRTSYKAYEKT